MLLSGSIAGMLLARAFAGMLGGWLGWRAPYLLDAGVMLALTQVVVAVLPSDAPRPTGSCSRRLLGERSTTGRARKPQGAHRARRELHES
jgi:predicted MFS family arabinose efflux permease